MSNKREVVLSIGVQKELYEALLNEVHKNKLLNLKKDFKGDERKPDNINELVRDILKRYLIKE